MIFFRIILLLSYIALLNGVILLIQHAQISEATKWLLGGGSGIAWALIGYIVNEELE